MTTTMLYIGFPAPFAGILGELPDGHPLWVLFDAAFGRYVKCCDLLDCPAFTIATAERLGLEVDPALPWFVEPPVPEANGDAAPEQIYRIHVRGIGVDGWDGTEAGTGSYENEEALKKIFAEFGEVKAVTIRHRIEDGKNTSWALIELDSAEAVDKAVAGQVKVRSDAPPKSIRGLAACAQRVNAMLHAVVAPFGGSQDEVNCPTRPHPCPSARGSARRLFLTLRLVGRRARTRSGLSASTRRSPPLRRAAWSRLSRRTRAASWARPWHRARKRRKSVCTGGGGARAPPTE